MSNLPMAIDTSIQANQCQFELIKVSNHLYLGDFLIEVNHQLIESKIAIFLGLNELEVEKSAVAIDLNYKFGRSRMMGLTIAQVQQLFQTTQNQVANKYKPILSELILTQVMPLFNPQPKHDDFKKEIDMNIITTNEPLTMSSQEMADLTETRHDNVKRTIEMLQNKGLISFTQIEEPTKGGGKPKTIYHVNKRDSYVVVARLSPEFTARLVDRWQELENKVATNLPNFANPAEAAIAWAEQYKQTEALAIELKAKEQILEEAKPMIGFAETAQKADKGILIRDLAYLAQNDGIKIGEKRLWTWFRAMGFIHQRSTRPMQEYIERGYFAVQPTFVHHNSGMQEHMTTKITGKGQIYFLQKLKEFFNLGGKNEQNNTLPV